MGVDLKQYCGEVNGHDVVIRFLNSGGDQLHTLREKYRHALSCDSCMSGIEAAAREHLVGNRLSPYETHTDMMNELRRMIGTDKI